MEMCRLIQSREIDCRLQKEMRSNRITIMSLRPGCFLGEIIFFTSSVADQLHIVRLLHQAIIKHGIHVLRIATVLD